MNYADPFGMLRAPGVFLLAMEGRAPLEWGVASAARPAYRLY